MQTVTAGGQRIPNGRKMQRPHMEGNWRERDSANAAAQNRANRGAAHGSVSGTKSPQTASQAQQRESHTTPNVEVAMSDHPFRFLCCLIGHVVRVETRDGHVFEGVFHALSQKMVLALTYVHDRCQDDRNEKVAREQSDAAPGDVHVPSNLCEGVPHADDLVELLMIDWSNVVKLEKSGVELTDFLGLSAAGGAPLTDSEIASASMTPQFGGQRSEKQLVPFFADADGDLEIEATPTSLDDATGWSVDDMFRENEKKFNATTDYDERFYTTALPHADTPEFRARDERARRLADSINRTTSARALEAENDEKADEEMHYSAVHRVDRRSAQPPNARRDRDRPATATPSRGTQPPARPSPAPAPAPTEPTPAPAPAAPPAPAQSAANTSTSVASTQGTATAPVASAPTTNTSNNTTAASAPPSSAASRTSFNPNAPAFVFNPNARSFAPTGPAQSAPSASSSSEAAPQHTNAPHSTPAPPAPQPPPNAARASSFSAAATPAAPAASVPQPGETMSATSVASAPTVNAPVYANPPGAQPPVAANMPQPRPGTAQSIPIPQVSYYPGNPAYPQAQPFSTNLAGQAQPHPTWIPQPNAHAPVANAVWMPQAPQPNAAQPTWTGPPGPGAWVVTDMQQAPPDAAARNNPQYAPHGAAPANTFAMPPGTAPQPASAAARDTPLAMQQQSFAPAPHQQQPVSQAQINNAAQQPSAFPQQVQQVGTVPFNGQQQPGATPYFMPAQSPPNAQTAAVTQLAVNPYQQQPVVNAMTGIYQGTMMPMAAQNTSYMVMPENVQQPPPPPQDSQMAMQQASLMVSVPPNAAGSRGPLYYMGQPYSVVDHGAGAQQGAGPAPTHQLQPAQHPPAQPNAAHVPQPHGPASSGPDSHNTNSKRRPTKQGNPNYRPGAPNTLQSTPYANQQQNAPTSGSASLNSSAGATVLAAGTSAGRNAGPNRQRNAADQANAADQPPGRDTPPQAATMNPAGVAYQQAATINRPGSAGPFQRPVAPNVPQVHGASLSLSQQQQQQLANNMMVAQPMHYFQPTAPNALQSGSVTFPFVPGHMDMQATYLIPSGLMGGVPLSYMIRAQNPNPPNPVNAAVQSQVRLNSAN